MTLARVYKSKVRKMVMMMIIRLELRQQWQFTLFVDSWHATLRLSSLIRLVLMVMRFYTTILSL